MEILWCRYDLQHYLLLLFRSFAGQYILQKDWSMQRLHFGLVQTYCTVESLVMIGHISNPAPHKKLLSGMGMIFVSPSVTLSWHSLSVLKKKKQWANFKKVQNTVKHDFFIGCYSTGFHFFKLNVSY